MLKGNPLRYGAVAMTFHWLSAAAVFALLVLGFLAASASDDARRALLLRVHVPLGAGVLLLMLLRLAWWFLDRRPDEPAGQPRWQTLTAHATHTMLYIVLVLMGMSGIGLVVVSGAGKVLFSGSPAGLPHFLDFAPMLVHGTTAFVLIALLAAHVGAALYHHLVRRDHLLARMGIGASEHSSG